MSEPLRIKSTNPILNWATAFGVVGLAGCGFTLSFSALRDLAVKSGIDSQLAFLWPLIVDGFIVVATAAAFALKARGGRVTWYPWSALIFFSAISVVGNSIHATGAVNLRVPIVVATIVSSVPAIALLLASHLLVVMVDGRAKPATQAARKRQTTALEPVIQRVDASPARKPSTPSAAAEPTPALEAKSHGSGNAEPTDVAALARLREHRESGHPITGALVARELGVSERTGRRRLEHFKTAFPDLFEPDPTS
jgi:hypothetical protein